MSEPRLRAETEDVVRGLLLDLADCDDDEEPTGWLRECLERTSHVDALGRPMLTVGEIRERLRWTLEELAVRDAT